MDFREATSADVPAMEQCRAGDIAAGRADPRMVAYFDGKHHPHQALPPRAGFVAVDDDVVIGYIAGHRTRRLDCDGEVQYLYVAPSYRRRGIAGALLRSLAQWFETQGILKVCVDVNVTSPGASPFYLSHGAIPLDRHWYVWADIRTILP